VSANLQQNPMMLVQMKLQYPGEENAKWRALGGSCLFNTRSFQMGYL